MAVSMDGTRLGKGMGFAELEWAILSEMGDSLIFSFFLKVCLLGTKFCEAFIFRYDKNYFNHNIKAELRIREMFSRSWPNLDKFQSFEIS